MAMNPAELTPEPGRSVSPIGEENEERFPGVLSPTRAGYAVIPSQETEVLGRKKETSPSSNILIKEHGDTPGVGTWPLAPQPLHRPLTSSVLNAFADTLLIICPFLFLALAVAALALNGQETLHSRLGPHVQEASKFGSTVFQIIFAALVSRALKSTGRLFAESGIKLGNLQNLLVCSSTFNAFINPLLVQQFTLVSVPLMALWSLSPLGGQAALRVVFIANDTTISLDHPLRYMDTGPAGILYAGEHTLIGLDGELTPTIQLGFVASLFQSAKTKLGPEDNWGNVKIPRIESLDLTRADDKGWVPFNTTKSEVESYSSLLGIPISDIPATGNASFTVESSYLSLQCASLKSNVTYKPPNGGSLNILCNGCPGNSTASVSILDPTSEEIDRTYYLLGVNTTASTNASEFFAQTLDFYSRDSAGYSHTACLVSETHVETMINCTTGSCEATSIRHSATDYRPANVTSFDYWATAALVAINAASIGSDGFSSASEVFLNDSYTVPVTTYNGAELPIVNLSSIPPDLFAARASMILNTAIQLVLSSTGFAESLPPGNQAYYGPNYTIPATALSNDTSYYGHNVPGGGIDQGTIPPEFQNITAPFVGALAEATFSNVTEVYRPSYVWVTILIIASTILLVVGVVGIIFDRMAKAPDVFDPAAAWTYDNRYLGVPETGTTLDRLDRVRLLKGVVVRVGDVQAKSETGKIGLGWIGNTGKVKKGRLYV